MDVSAGGGSIEIESNRIESNRIESQVEDQNPDEIGNDCLIRM
jgi:hypothetical protein